MESVMDTGPPEGSNTALPGGSAPIVTGEKTPGASLQGRPSVESTPRTEVSQLASFEKGLEKSRAKRVRTSQLPSSDFVTDTTVLNGTPRAKRFENIFAGTTQTPSMKDVVVRLHQLAEKNLILPERGSETIKQVPSEAAADIKTLIAKLVDMTNINPIPPPTESRPILTPNFGFSPSEVLAKKVDGLAFQMSQFQAAISPILSQQNQSATKTNSTKKTSYAQMTSKHAPQPGLIHNVNTKRTTRPAPKQVEATNKMTLYQTLPEKNAVSTLKTSELMKKINDTLQDQGIKISKNASSSIRVRAIHRHPSNDLVLYSDSAKEIKALIEAAPNWLSLISNDLEVRKPTYGVVVHAVATSFNPKANDHVENLKVANHPILEDMVEIKWLTPGGREAEKPFSSLLITFHKKEDADRAVKEKIWVGYRKQRTEIARRAPPRCLNCKQKGHKAVSCKAEPMCPYCGDKHHSHTCPRKGLVAPKCTSCARAAKSRDPNTNIRILMDSSPPSLLHSPFDGSCPSRNLGIPDALKNTTQEGAPEPAPQDDQMTL